MNEHLSMLLGLGPNAEWPYTEKSIIELISLQREKEVTKQLYYKTENINKSIELLNTCLNANIPSYLIPMVFAGDGFNPDLINRLAESQLELKEKACQQQLYKYPPPTTGKSTSIPVSPHPNSQKSKPPLPAHQNPVASSSAHLAPPVSLYRTRPLSPAKIGAAAVSQLDRGRYPSSPIHRRNISLPVTALNYIAPPSKIVKSPSQKVNNNTASKTQQSMMNTIGSIQFVNENPGKKRRRSSGAQKEGHESDESNDKENKREVTTVKLESKHETHNPVIENYKSQ